MRIETALPGARHALPFSTFRPPFEASSPVPFPDGAGIGQNASEPQVVDGDDRISVDYITFEPARFDAGGWNATTPVVLFACGSTALIGLVVVDANRPTAEAFAELLRAPGVAELQPRAVELDLDFDLERTALFEVAAAHGCELVFVRGRPPATEITARRIIRDVDILHFTALARPAPSDGGRKTVAPAARLQASLSAMLSRPL